MAAPTPVPGLWLLHVDLDQYVAAVEIRRNPELRGLPVVVGGAGDPTAARQVVSTASYEAREYGVHSGMPLRVAARKCPDAVFLPVDGPAYDAASAEVMDVLRTFGHPLEVWGWDEAVLGARVDQPLVLAEQLRTALLEATEFTCAVGVGDTKERAKMATRFAKAKPLARDAMGRVYQLDASVWMDVMGDRPAIDLWGIGTRTAAKLTAHDIHTVRDLALVDPRAMAGWFGPTIGPGLKLLGMGGASTHIATEPYVAKSRSKQVTFPRDLTDRSEIETKILELADDVSAEVFGQGRVGTHVGVTVRTSTFFTRVKTGKLPAPSTDAAEIRRGAMEVLARFELDRPVRLLGVRIDLADPESGAVDPERAGSGAADLSVSDPTAIQDQ